MVHWGWLIVACMAGAAFGALVMALLAAGARIDMEVQYQHKIKCLKDEIRSLKRKLA